jgi:hypothetical protein
VTNGASYFVDVADYSSSTLFTYTLTVNYISLNDLYEPNDTRFDAKPIPLNTAISAYMFAGYPTGMIAPYDDYFAVNMAAGGFTVTLSYYPADVSPHVTIYNTQGTQLVSMTSTSTGAGLTVPATAAAAGLYYVQFTPYNTPVAAGIGQTLPDHFTRPYMFTVTQP